MSAIVHRCQCGQTQPNHNRFKPKGCTGERYGAPELIRTFDKAGEVVDRIVPPGDWELMKAKTCSCADCKALYDSLCPAGGVG